MTATCILCNVTWIGDHGDEAIIADFMGHMESHKIVGVAPSAPTAPLPTTHGSVPVERGTIARPAGGVAPARHPSAGVRTGRGGAA